MRDRENELRPIAEVVFATGLDLCILRDDSTTESARETFDGVSLGSNPEAI